MAQKQGVEVKDVAKGGKRRAVRVKVDAILIINDNNSSNNNNNNGKNIDNKD